MVRISHEVPTKMLKASREFNDYDYCLLHLIDIPEYRDYYIESSQMGRDVLLDNSLFELGDALTTEDVRKGVIILKPKWVVVPDCRNDADTTIDRFIEWEKECSDLDVLTIGVVHGKDLNDMIKCYKFMSEHADKIALPFISNAFEELAPNEDKLRSWAEGRQKFVQLLVDEGIWCSKPHHLLGCSYAWEFKYYKEHNIDIDTVDTSNPIVAAIVGLEYTEKGLDTKPSIMLNDLIDYSLNEEQLELMYKNVNIFKNICN